MQTPAVPTRGRVANIRALRIVSRPCEVTQHGPCRTWNQNLEPEPGTRTWNPGKSRYTPVVGFAPEYISCVLNDNYEDAKTFFLAPLMAIHRAHLVMLADRGIVTAADAHALRVALDAVPQEDVRKSTFDGSCEDLFFYVERLIVNACGDDTAGRLHVARSRNDIDMTMYRMRQREFVLA